MRSCRGAVGLILLLFVALPAVFPFVELLRRPEAWSAWQEFGRLFALARTTLLLVVGTLVLALPTGTLLAVLLQRTDLSGRHWLNVLLLVPLFVPLPLLVAGWTMVFDALALPLTGLGAALVLHVLAALPWVVLLVGLGLCHVERLTEEDALTAAPPWQVLLRVTLRRALPALVAAALWVAVQTAAEVGVTDLFQVRTFAEEVYTQLVRPVGDADVDVLAARAVAVNVPAVLLFGGLTLLLVQRGQSRLPPLVRLSRPLLFPLGRGKGLVSGIVALLVGALVGVPIAGLLWRAGQSGAPPEWSWSVVAFHVGRAWRLDRGLLSDALLLAAWVGVQTTALALLACWLAREQRGFRTLVFVVAVLAWTLPGPLVGLGLKQAINGVLKIVEVPIVAELLYFGPSWLPVAWVQSIRLFPFAVALLWPTLRALPRDLFESARLDGATPSRELRHVVLPLTRSACCSCVLIVAALSLGEVSASKLISTPGATPFGQHVFMELHYGVGNHLAAQCLLLLAVLALVGPIALRTQFPPTMGSGRNPSCRWHRQR